MSHIERPRYVPLSTYRLQVHAGFTLPAASNVVPYLERLGIGACYTSPYFTAAPGSTHGYDICNHNEISPEAGGAEAHADFTGTLQQHGLGHVVDFVPNHMGVGTGRNALWSDVLENGPSSTAARYFDVEWRPAKPELRDKLLLPILGSQYGRALERGELQLAFRDGLLVVRYFDEELPINPRQTPRVYRVGIERLTERMGAKNPRLNEFLSILASLQNLPPFTDDTPESVAERQREKEVARARLARLAAASPEIREHIETAIRTVNGEPGRPESFDALHDLLEAQAYRLAYWRTASHEINYRRFFDINTLAGLRVENPDVFNQTHRLLRELLASGRVNAVRIDHPDGLFDPARYFEMLQDLASDAWEIERVRDASPRPDRPLYVVAEKILSGGERLPLRWAVHGTTGYSYLNDLNGLFVDGSQARRLRRVYAKLTGRGEPFDDVLYWSKRLIMTTAMASELTVLAHTLDEIGESNRRSRDFTLESLADAITEVIACFPAYRTYVDEGGWTPEDRAVLETAIVRARHRNPAMEASLFDFFREVVLPREVEDNAERRPNERREGYPPADAREARERLRFAMKLQQYTGPVQAKGLEDTAFYRYNLLLSLNEVGGDPSRVGRSVAEFHEANLRRLRDWPFEVLATATHDTKLGEDVRARINVLSELPDEWGREVSRWMRTNRSHRVLIDGEPAPDRNDEYRFYQALTGVWPPELTAVAQVPADLVQRIQHYMLKAVKEAKIHTSWLTPNEQYEEALRTFVDRVLLGPSAPRFLHAFLPFQQRIARLGMVNSLAQVALKLGSPGVPDFYQGCEMWDFSLVDPDNRRPVDFDVRRRSLDEVESILGTAATERAERIRTCLDCWKDGRMKLLVTAAGLRLRKEWPELFLAGEYLPLDPEISVRGSAVAFARVDGTGAAVFVAPRLCAPLVDAEHPFPIGGETWKTSRLMIPPQLADRTFRNEITGAEIRPVVIGQQPCMFVGQVLETLPVAILRTV